MRRVVCLVGLGGLAMLTPAAAQDAPQVISGIHPASQPRAAASSRGGALGGGFVEFLLTGRTDSARRREPQVAAAPAYRPDYAPRPEDSASPGYAPHRAAFAALAAPDSERVAAEPPAEFQRQEVAYDTHERAGTIVIDTPNKFLYLVEPGGRAMRYGVGVGRPGFSWAGVKTISRKAEWPDWTPPPEMMLRRPDLPSHMDGGPENPLGARALYLGSSMYRIHGTNEPWTIGQNVSSGCIRMMNRDVMDLYERVKVGTKVIVM